MYPGVGLMDHYGYSIFTFLGEGEKHWCERETLISCLPYTSWPGPNLPHRHVPWLGTNPWPLSSRDDATTSGPTLAKGSALKEGRGEGVRSAGFEFWLFDTCFTVSRGKPRRSPESPRSLCVKWARARRCGKRPWKWQAFLVSLWLLIRTIFPPPGHWRRKLCYTVNAAEYTDSGKINRGVLLFWPVNRKTVFSAKYCVCLERPRMFLPCRTASDPTVTLLGNHMILI